MPEKTSSKNVSPDGQNYSSRMKFYSQTTPLTTFSLSLTICHAVQTHTFHPAVLMAAPTNLQIGTEHKSWVRSITKKETTRLIQIMTI